MATVQHLVIVNGKSTLIICRIKPDLNRTSRETTKDIEVVQVHINLMAGDHKVIMNILVPLTLLLQVLLTTLIQVLQIGVHNNRKLNQIECQRWKILEHNLCMCPSQTRRTPMLSLKLWKFRLNNWQNNCLSMQVDLFQQTHKLTKRNSAR